MLFRSTEMDRFLDVVIEIGKKMIVNGAEIWRVEDTLSRIFDAYEYPHAEVYASTTLIVCTIDAMNGETATRSVRVSPTTNNLEIMEELNTLSRYICEHKPTTAKIQELLNKDSTSKYATIYLGIGYFLCSSSCAIFFGGNLGDGLLSGLIALCIFFIDHFTQLKGITKHTAKDVSC